MVWDWLPISWESEKVCFPIIVPQYSPTKAGYFLGTIGGAPLNSHDNKGELEASSIGPYNHRTFL